LLWQLNFCRDKLEQTITELQLQKRLSLPRTRLAAIAALIVYFAGCSTVDQKYGDQAWYQKSKQASSKAIDVTTTTATKAVEVTSTTASKAYTRMQQYLAEKDVLKTFYDAGEHSEAAVLGVLHKSGITKRQAAAPPSSGALSSGASRTPKHAPAPAPLSTVPEQYAGSMRWPLDAYIVSSEYGERWGKVHKGMDMAAHVGEPVYAIADGEVIYAGDGLRGYGNCVILRHDRKTSSLYAHNSELKVKQGDQVTKGTLVALLGNTGHSTGPHVHFEIRDGDAAVNPRNVLPKSKLGLWENTVATPLAGIRR
jgi:murein DD-endopeptidase MepM/ murein hydrolase activator NlpD